MRRQINISGYEPASTSYSSSMQTGKTQCSWICRRTHAVTSRVIQGTDDWSPYPLNVVNLALAARPSKDSNFEAVSDYGTVVATIERGHTPVVRPTLQGRIDGRYLSGGSS
jgi:hypothetical protein